MFRNPISDKRQAVLFDYAHRQIQKMVKKGNISDPKLIFQQVEQVGDADPTASGQYCKWIIDLVLNGRVGLPEDSEKIRDLLALYHKVKAKLPLDMRNIFNFKSYSALRQELMARLPELKSQTELVADGTRSLAKMTSRGGTEFELIQLSTPQAASVAAKNTGWCVCSPQTAADYLADGNLYLITVNNQRFALCHWKSSQVMDINDVPIMPDNPRYAEIKVLLETLGDSENFLCDEHNELENLVCGECDEHGCVGCGLELCGVCKETVSCCHKKYCDECEKLVCSDCLDHSHWGSLVCPACTNSCADCTNELCMECSYSCEDCGDTICERCIEVCEYCDRSGCESCLALRTCSDCLQRACETCADETWSKCDCGDMVCDRHAVECSQCGEGACSRCEKRCDRCEQWFCVSCTTFCHYCLKDHCDDCNDEEECEVCGKDHVHGAAMCRMCDKFLCDFCERQCQICNQAVCREDRIPVDEDDVTKVVCKQCFPMFCTVCNAPIKDAKEHIACAYVRRKRR